MERIGNAGVRGGGGGGIVAVDRSGRGKRGDEEENGNP